MIVLSFGCNTRTFAGHIEQYDQTVQQYIGGRYAVTRSRSVSVVMLRVCDMITPDKIKVKPLKVYLTAITNKGNYGQTYDLSDKTKTNYVPDLTTAKERFMDFYNQFE